MGNIFGQPETQYPETLDQEGISEILRLLGTVNGPTLESNPAEITNSRFNSDCALSTHLSEISVSDPELLNLTLETIADHLIEKLSSNERAVEVFPKESENFLFKCGHLGQVRPGKDGYYQNYQIQEYLKRDIGGPERIRRVLRGFCVYQFKNESLQAISRAAQVPIEDVYVGVHNGEFMTFAPQVSLEATDCLKITWWVYELDDDTYIALPGTGGGVTLNEKNTINVMDISGLRELVFWSRDGDEESLAKFEKWYTLVMERGQCWALCDGEVEGDLVELEDFLDRVDTTGDVFDEESNEAANEVANEVANEAAAEAAEAVAENVANGESNEEASQDSEDEAPVLREVPL